MSFSKSTKPYVPDQYQNRGKRNLYKHSSIDRGDLCQTIRKLVENIKRSHGIHSHNAMGRAGFEYINKGDTSRCRTCGLEVSRWMPDMEPFLVHKQHRPTCPFVQSKSSSLERFTIEINAVNTPFNILVEVNILEQMRKRTFSHWPHRSSPSASQMIEAGFFNCNVGDRVICIYCNIICEQWTPNSDDPCEVHKTLSPKCPYVIAMLITSPTSSISIINEASANVDPIRSQAIVHTAACNPNYSETLKRNASFATWPNENLPSVDDLVKAGFFFSGTKTIVTCFYCNGSLQNWGAKGDPMIEHARWFPHCAYAKQLCGVDLHRKIQESKRAQQERARSNNADNRSAVDAGNSNDGRLLIPDESTLSRLVAARLDLPVSQRLLRNFKRSVIERCLEDQLRLKYEDFASDSDLFMACTILQKQMEIINGQKENIIVPSVTMKRIREQEQTEVRARELTISTSSSVNSSGNNDFEVTTSSTKSDINEIGRRASSNLNPCGLCLAKEWCIALLPCAHVRTEIHHEHLL